METTALEQIKKHIKKVDDLLDSPYNSERIGVHLLLEAKTNAILALHTIEQTIEKGDVR